LQFHHSYLPNASPVQPKGHSLQITLKNKKEAILTSFGCIGELKLEGGNTISS